MDDNRINDSDNFDESNISEEELKLKAEMEELARTFQEELDKAKAEEELRSNELEKEQEVLIQELEDDIKFDTEAVEDIPEDELCECCGVKRRGTKDNPDSPYCRDCERGLRRYPFQLLNVLIVLIILGLSIFACISFAGRAQLYSTCAKADRYEKQKLLFSAYGSYSNSIKYMQDNEINGELVYQRAVKNLLLTNMLDDIPQYETQFKMFEFKLPHLKDAFNTFKTYEGFRITQLDGYQILYNEIDKIDKEGNGDYTKLPYAEIIGSLDALLSVSTEESYKYQASLAEGAEESPDYPVKVDRYDESMINFIKFYTAALSEQDEQIQIEYLEKIRVAHPELTWMYSAFLGDLYNRTGKDTAELCEQIKKNNAEDEAAEVIEVTSLRISGKYTECISLAQKNIDRGSSYSYEFYRQQAICYLITNDYSNAYKAANSAYENYSNSIQVCETFAICSLAANKASGYDDIAKLFEDNGVEMSKDVLDYKNGEKTLEEIFTQGGFDIQ